ncbi:hypothetical protein Y032_0009g667 [Ancylostoma ceylanicum]|uniref:Tudor domain-containing protein n=1 Tax=Ancylostoma ceylanicum TaxID=53326 RepID=A0A016VJ68_9BILA|nr:hypothetical protein Y032_0009g667 [Ancylostoma ceylanicum]
MSGDARSEDLLVRFDLEKSGNRTKQLAFEYLGLPPLRIAVNPDGTVDAHITSITGPDRFFLSQKLTNLSKMSLDLESNTPKPLPAQGIGRFAMVRLPDYKGLLKWMRAIVIVQEKTYAEVLAIDSGAMVTVPLPSLFKMTREWNPIPPLAFPVRMNSSQFFPSDVKRLLWKKVNVEINSIDDKNFLCDEVNFYTVEDELVDLSVARTKNLSSFIPAYDITAAHYRLLEAPPPSKMISIPGIVVASLGVGLAIVAIIIAVFLVLDIVKKSAHKGKTSAST